MSLESWKSQLRKGAAELAVLSLLEKTEYSGISLLEELTRHPDIGLSEGTIYPLLNRLKREGRIKGIWQSPESGGREQKVYRLTAKGRAALREMRAEWVSFRDQLSLLTGEG